MSIFPEYPWKLFEFRTRITWNQPLALLFLEQIASQQNIGSLSAWRTVSYTQLKDHKGGNSLLSHSHTLKGALR